MLPCLKGQIILLLIYFISSLASSTKINYSSETQAILTFSQAVTEGSSFAGNEIEEALNKKYWSLARSMILEYYNPKNIDLFPLFQKYKKKKLTQDQKVQFENLTGLLPLDSPSLQKISPAFLWAQNMTFLMVKIKFSPKLDTPGVLEVQNVNITFQHDRFIFSALSLDQGEVPIHYYLEIVTFHHLNTHFCWWKYDSVGTVYLEMMKSPAPYFWRNIHPDQFKRLPNQHMWWDVYYNYMEDFNSYGANALLLFDQRELERERKEEEEEFKTKMKKRDENLQKKRTSKIEKEFLQAYRNKMYCWYSYQDKKHKVLNIHDWEAWLY